MSQPVEVTLPDSDALPPRSGRPPGSLSQEASEALGELRVALGAVIRAAAGSPRRATDLQQALKIDSKLAWAIFKVATAQDPLSAGVYVPGRGPMTKVLGAAGKKGAPPDAVERARAAFERFEAMVERHAGDRSSFDSMITDLAGEPADSLDLASKRAAFRANGRLWGVQARCGMWCSIVQPSSELPGGLDTVRISGRTGLRQLRTGKTMRTEFRTRVTPDAGPGQTAGVIRQVAIDPEDALEAGGVGLMRPFCSVPLPQFRSEIDAEGWLRTELMSRGLGNTAAVDYFLGSVVYGYMPALVGTPEGPHWFFLIATPMEVVYQDLLIHDDAFAAPDIGPPRVRVYGTAATPGNPDSWRFREEDLLPVQERIGEIGRGPESLSTPDIPRYPEIAAYAIEKLGWDPSRFRVFRCRVEYPVQFSLLRIDFPEVDAAGK
jgi:hypothetical protein